MPDLRFRQIHLDFHTSPHIREIGADFDADAFAQQMQRAHVDSVTVFAKCHHGMCYYDTQHGVRHPGLTFDLMRAQIDALHRRGIRAPIYMTCVWDMHMAAEHPDWRQRRADGTPLGPPDGEPGWKWICLGSPYLEYQLAQTREILERYPVDGFFYDIVFQTDPGCCCDYCRAAMADLGLDPGSESDLRRHSQLVVERFVGALTDTIRAARPDATVFFNGRVRQGMADETRWLSHAEIEALPTGGWGYAYFPFWVRYARNFGLPTMGMTGRFHRTWADFGGLKAPAALRFECGSMLANGSACSIGDQLHPRGVLDPAVYDVIGEAFADVEAKEEWARSATPRTEIALLLTAPKNESDDGAARMLLELHHQFEILDAAADWSRFAALVIADRAEPDPALIQRLQAYLAGGGSLLLSSDALVDPTTGQFALPEIGLRRVGAAEHKPCFFTPRPGACEGVRQFPYVLVGGATETETLDATETLADLWASYFNRTGECFTSHGYSPRTEPTGKPAATLSGRVAYIASPVFRDYQEQGDTVLRKLVGALLARLLPKPILTTNAPPSAEVTVMRQADRTVIHVVNYQPNRRGAHVEVIEEVAPLHDVTLNLRSDREPSWAYSAPDHRPLSLTWSGGVATVTLPRVAEHAMAVIED